jgi:hypothetical protein
MVDAGLPSGGSVIRVVSHSLGRRQEDWAENNYRAWSKASWAGCLLEPPEVHW